MIETIRERHWKLWRVPYTVPRFGELWSTKQDQSVYQPSVFCFSASLRTWCKQH